MEKEIERAFLDTIAKALVSLPFAEHAGVATMEPGAVAPLHAAARDLAQFLGEQRPYRSSLRHLR